MRAVGATRMGFTSKIRMKYETTLVRQLTRRVKDVSVVKSLLGNNTDLIASAKERFTIKKANHSNVFKGSIAKQSQVKGVVHSTKVSGGTLFIVPVFEGNAIISKQIAKVDRGIPARCWQVQK